MCKENKNKIVISDLKFSAKAITLKNSQNQIKYEQSRMSDNVIVVHILNILEMTAKCNIRNIMMSLMNSVEVTNGFRVGKLLSW